MVTAVRSLGLQGISGYEVTVECFLSGGLPAFDIVGLGDTAVKESRERVRAAVKNCGVKFPVSRITVNLARRDSRKKERSMICRSFSVFSPVQRRSSLPPGTRPLSASFRSPAHCAR